MATNNRARLLMGKRDPWSPHVLSRSVLRAIWHADNHGVAALMTDDGAGLISSWKDLINLVNPTATTTLRPTWAATSFDGSRAGVTFDGAATAMTTTTITALPTGAVAGEMWLVGNFTTGIAFAYGTTGAAGRRFSFSQSPAIVISDNSTTISTTSANAPHVVGGWWSGTTMGGSIDGTDVTSATIATLATATTRLRLGAQVGTSPGTFAAGAFRVGAVTTLLPTADRQRMQGWLAWDSGLQASLPTSHPYRYAAP